MPVANIGGGESRHANTGSSLSRQSPGHGGQGGNAVSEPPGIEPLSYL